METETQSILGLPIRPCEETGGFRLIRDTSDGYELDILIMMFNIRLAETPIGLPVYDRYWCYEGRSLNTFLRVVAEAQTWNRDPEVGPEPLGWLKSWDQRYGRRLTDLAKR